MQVNIIFHDFQKKSHIQNGEIFCTSPTKGFTIKSSLTARTTICNFMRNILRFQLESKDAPDRFRTLLTSVCRVNSCNRFVDEMLCKGTKSTKPIVTGLNRFLLFFIDGKMIYEKLLERYSECDALERWCS